MTLRRFHPSVGGKRALGIGLRWVWGAPHALAPAAGAGVLAWLQQGIPRYKHSQVLSAPLLSRRHRLHRGFGWQRGDQAAPASTCT